MSFSCLWIFHHIRDELLKIRSKSLNTKLNRKTRQMDEEVDNDLFQTLYISAVIKNWRGLKNKYLPKILPVQMNGADLEDELIYTTEDAELLMKNSTDFDSWVSTILEDVENFTQSS